MEIFLSRPLGPLASHVVLYILFYALFGDPAEVQRGGDI